MTDAAIDKPEQRFPFFNHRTLAEVEEQDKLERLYAWGYLKDRRDFERLEALRRKQKAANGDPP